MSAAVSFPFFSAWVHPVCYLSAISTSSRSLSFDRLVWRLRGGDAGYLDPFLGNDNGDNNLGDNDWGGGGPASYFNDGAVEDANDDVVDNTRRAYSSGQYNYIDERPVGEEGAEGIGSLSPHERSEKEKRYAVDHDGAAPTGKYDPVADIALRAKIRQKEWDDFELKNMMDPDLWNEINPFDYAEQFHREWPAPESVQDAYGEFPEMDDSYFLPPPLKKNVTFITSKSNYTLETGVSFDPCPMIPDLLEDPSDPDLNHLETMDYSRDRTDGIVGPYIWRFHFLDNSTRAEEEREKPPLYVPMPRNFLLWANEKGPLNVRTVLMAHPVTRDGLLINPAGDYPQIVHMARQIDMNVKAIVLTTGLFYHSLDLKHCWESFGRPPIYMGREERNLWHRYWEQPEKLGVLNEADIIGFDNYPPVTHWMADGDTLPALNGTALWTPGITNGSYTLYFKDYNFAFVGKGVYPKCELPISDTKILKKSIQQKILTLPPDTTLMGSTGDITTVKIERRFNPLKAPSSLTPEQKRLREKLQEEETFRDLVGRYKDEKERKRFEDAYQQAGYFPEFHTKTKQEDGDTWEDWCQLDDDTMESSYVVESDEEVGEWQKVKMGDLANMNRRETEDYLKFRTPGNRLSGEAPLSSETDAQDTDESIDHHFKYDPNVGYA
eukprot:jgi/Bigna1/86597/estExt_fgenesh1_pg.C_120044